MGADLLLRPGGKGIPFCLPEPGGGLLGKLRPLVRQNHFFCPAMVLRQVKQALPFQAPDGGVDGLLADAGIFVNICQGALAARVIQRVQHPGYAVGYTQPQIGQVVQRIHLADEKIDPPNFTGICFFHGAPLHVRNRTVASIVHNRIFVK